MLFVDTLSSRASPASGSGGGFSPLLQSRQKRFGGAAGTWAPSIRIRGSFCQTFGQRALLLVPHEYSKRGKIMQQAKMRRDWASTLGRASIYRGNKMYPSSAPSGTCASCGTARTPGSWATARRLARSLGASPTGQSARNVAHREAEKVGTCRLRRSLGMHTRARTCRRTASPHRAGALACRTGSAQQECVCVSSPSSKKKREQQDW